MSEKPHVLVTNDDGIQSAFLGHLVDALSAHFRVSVAAPASEQSWIGRAVSRHRDVKVVRERSLFADDVQAWTIDGTPTDCVNIALGNLLPEPPDIVVSGINIGFNTTETLILSSGTVAGAIEGALWGLPAVAFSQCVPRDVFEQVSQNNGQTEGAFTENLRAAAAHAANITRETLANPPTVGCVFNINFPAEISAASQTADTYPAKIKLGSLYAESSPGVFNFRYSDGVMIDTDKHSDRAALERGLISRSLLDFSKVGPRP
jgi:5'-nucleotidase